VFFYSCSCDCHDDRDIKLFTVSIDHKKMFPNRSLQLVFDNKYYRIKGNYKNNDTIEYFQRKTSDSLLELSFLIFNRRSALNTFEIDAGSLGYHKVIKNVAVFGGTKLFTWCSCFKIAKITATDNDSAIVITDGLKIEK
jgi:hypothetical protein